MRQRVRETIRRTRAPRPSPSVPHPPLLPELPRDFRPARELRDVSPERAGPAPAIDRPSLPFPLASLAPRLETLALAATESTSKSGRLATLPMVTVPAPAGGLDRPRAWTNDLKDLVEDSLDELVRDYGERFRSTYGPLHPLVKDLLGARSIHP